jgi:hypothetical protein
MFRFSGRPGSTKTPTVTGSPPVDQIVEDDAGANLAVGIQVMWPSWNTMRDAGSEARYWAGTYSQ